jgi:hypothetical protein
VVRREHSATCHGTLVLSTSSSESIVNDRALLINKLFVFDLPTHRTIANLIITVTLSFVCVVAVNKSLDNSKITQLPISCCSRQVLPNLDNYIPVAFIRLPAIKERESVCVLSHERLPQPPSPLHKYGSSFECVSLCRFKLCCQCLSKANEH